MTPSFLFQLTLRQVILILSNYSTKKKKSFNLFWILLRIICLTDSSQLKLLNLSSNYSTSRHFLLVLSHICLRLQVFSYHVLYRARDVTTICRYLVFSGSKCQKSLLNKLIIGEDSGLVAVSKDLHEYLCTLTLVPDILPGNQEEFQQCWAPKSWLKHFVLAFFNIFLCFIPFYTV